MCGLMLGLLLPHESMRISINAREQAAALSDDAVSSANTSEQPVGTGR